MIGPEMMKLVEPLNNNKVRCLSCQEVFTEEGMRQHVGEYCFPNKGKEGEGNTAYRTELLKREPCWHCSKALVNIHGKCSSPYVAYIAQIMGFDRKLHRRCAEGLGFKCIAISEK